ncbi:MAG: methyltransferase [Rickettsiales bacterium]|nr:methyltransferase [Rickettsiales bacterium]
MQDSEIKEIFASLYGNIDGYEISKQARKDSKINTEKFLYGELPLETCKDILEFANPKKGLFCDLGSGTGRVVLAMQLLGNFKKSAGVEILEGLHNQSTKIHNFLKENYPQLAKHISFHNNDIFKTKLHNVDFILMNHPFKDGEIFHKLEEKFLNELKPGTKIVTIIRALKDPSFKKIATKTLKFSWGDSSVHFFER